MTSDFSKITIHMVSSLDGFIAKKDNSISWFETSGSYDKGIDEEDHEAFLKTIDCYVMGSKTYEHAIKLSANYGWPYGDKPTFVLTNRKLSADKPNIEFHSGDMHKFVNEKLRPFYKNIWVAGGSEVVKDFIRESLADEIRITILPIILGDGLHLFNHIGNEIALHLKDSKAYKTGIVELCYEIQNN